MPTTATRSALTRCSSWPQGRRRRAGALVNLLCRSLPIPPAAIMLDIDDTCDAAHGHQELSLFHAHHDTRCFPPVHIYHVESVKPVAVHCLIVLLPPFVTISQSLSVAGWSPPITSMFRTYEARQLSGT